LENLDVDDGDDDDDDDDIDISMAWEIIRKYIKTTATESLGYCELKQHIP
jgi:hypothetical protein